MPQLKVEHVAFNVSDPEGMAAWYETHLGMRVVRRTDSARTHFFVDAGGAVVIEVYNNPADAVPDYPSLHPLRLHLAFDSADVPADTAALLAAGATLVEEQRLPDGSELAMLRDPWGLAIQLCRRTTPLLPRPDREHE